MDIIHLECKAIKDAIKNWQYYFMGKEFYVCSDHKPLENLKTKSRTDKILGDLVHYLSQFHFKIIYTKGKDNKMADLLSRQPVLEYFENPDIIRVANLVNNDEIIKDQNTNSTELNTATKTKIYQNITYKNINGRSRIFVSQIFGAKLIEQIHKHYGHIGVFQMQEIIRPAYYFKNMNSMISEFCKQCLICRENKTRRGKTIGLMSQLGPATAPYEIMSIDTVGGFGGNKSTKKYMHILVDHFTRYAWISTSTGQLATDFIRLINKIAQKNKIKTILADRIQD